MTDDISVTIVIPNWNGRVMLSECLHSIFKHTEYPSFQVVVIDNGSSDGSVREVETQWPEVELLRNDTNVGYGPANNQAFARYEAEYYLLLNNDTEITQSGWLINFVNFALRNDSAVTGCKLVYGDGRLQHGGGLVRPGWSPTVQLNAQNIDNHRIDVNDVWKPDYVTGAAFLIRQDVIEETGGFDEAFSPAYFEETDLCFRAKEAGYSVYYTPVPTIVHHESQSSGSGMPEYYYRNQLRFVFRHFPISWLLLQVVYELRGVLGHLYHRRSLWNIYREVPKLLIDRLRQ